MGPNEKDSTINLANGNPLRNIYLERKLTIVGISEMPAFDARFK